ncbi:hypothetical protein [Loigolactobacillus rennini]|nr:hypothetical protein [Loigolactobacillus rennini]
MTILTAVMLIVLIIGLLFVGLVVQRLRRNRALRLLQNASKKITDQAVQTAVSQLVQQQRLPAATLTNLHSQIVADVWGRGVLVFSYALPLPTFTTAQARHLKPELTQALIAAAQKQGLTTFKTAHTVFAVSDIWLLKGQLHFDVAYLRNQATINYVQDMRKLSVEKGTN